MSLKRKIFLTVFISTIIVFTVSFSLIVSRVAKDISVFSQKELTSESKSYSEIVNDRLNKAMDLARNTAQVFENYESIPVLERRKVI